MDERLDPYSGRFFPREARTEVLGGVVRNERSVEGIVRGRTWGLVQERCGDGSAEGGRRRWINGGKKENEKGDRFRIGIGLAVESIPRSVLNASALAFLGHWWIGCMNKYLLTLSLSSSTWLII